MAAATDPAGPPPTTTTSGARITLIRAAFRGEVARVSIRLLAGAASRPALDLLDAISVEVDRERLLRGGKVRPGRPVQRRRPIARRVTQGHQHLVTVHARHDDALLDQLH